MRTAIVTGAGSGIGRAIALRLARDGHAIILVGRRVEPLERASAEIRAGGGEAFAVPADVTQPEQVEAMIRRAREPFGRIDVLVNNAGTAPRIALSELSVEQWRAILEANLSSAFYTTRAVWPIMRRQREAVPGDPGGGVIVNISSMAAKDPFAGLGAYGVAKAGINMLSLVTAREGHEAGIRCVCIAPAAVDTTMFRSMMEGHKIPEDVMLDPDDVAAMVADVVGGALKYCAGDTLYVHRRPS